MRHEGQAKHPLGENRATAGSRLLQAQPARSYAAMAQRQLTLAAARAQVQQVHFLDYASYCCACSATTSAAITALSIVLLRSDMPEDPMHGVHCPREDAWAGPPERLWGMLSGQCITAVRPCSGGSCRDCWLPDTKDIAHGPCGT